MSSDASKIYSDTADTSGAVAAENERREDAILRQNLETFFKR